MGVFPRPPPPATACAPQHPRTVPESFCPSAVSALRPPLSFLVSVGSPEHLPEEPGFVTIIDLPWMLSCLLSQQLQLCGKWGSNVISGRGLSRNFYILGMCQRETTKCFFEKVKVFSLRNEKKKSMPQLLRSTVRTDLQWVTL